MKMIRSLLAIGTTGLFWYLALNIFFVWSGAQRILADPGRQSLKFIRNFTEYEPLPRMTDPMVLMAGFWVCGALAAIAFILFNAGSRRPWWKAGLRFGLLHWLLMVPWFEFYLPYNVMHEPLALVLFEGLLWLGVTSLTGLYIAALVCFGNAKTS